MNLGLVCRSPQTGSENSVREDLSHERPVSVAVHDGNYLIAACPFSWVRWLKLRTFKGLIHVARDGARLVDGKGAVNKRGHALEGMRGKVVCRHILGERIYLYPIVRHALFMESKPGDPRIHAVLVAMQFNRHLRSDPTLS